MNPESESRVVSYLDLHASLLEDFVRALELYSKEEIVSHVRERVIFATSPLEIPLTLHGKHKNPQISLPIKTHFFFHNYACRGRVQYHDRVGEGNYGCVHLATLSKMSLACKQSRLPNFSQGLKTEKSDPVRFNKEIRRILEKIIGSQLSSMTEPCILQQLSHRKFPY